MLFPDLRAGAIIALVKSIAWTVHIIELMIATHDNILGCINLLLTLHGLIINLLEILYFPHVLFKKKLSWITQHKKD